MAPADAQESSLLVESPCDHTSHLVFYLVSLPFLDIFISRSQIFCDKSLSAHMHARWVGKRDKMIRECFALLQTNCSINLAEVSTDPGGKTLKICVYARIPEVTVPGLHCKEMDTSVLATMH